MKNDEWNIIARYWSFSEDCNIYLVSEYMINDCSVPNLLLDPTKLKKTQT
jgi:hypothetical protein